MTILGGLLLLAAGAQAQIAFRASTTAAVDAAGTISFVNDGGTATRNGCGSIAPSIPAGNVGDLLVAVIATGDDSTIAMTGWNQLFYNAGATNEAAALFWRIATGGDPNTITQSGNCNVIIARIARFRGVDAVQPIQTAPVAASNWSFQNATTVTTGTQGVPYADAFVVVTAHANDDSSFGTLSGFTRAFNVSTTTGNDAAIALYYDNPATTPPYTAGPFSISKSRGSDPNHGVVFALRPAGSNLALNVPAGTALDDVMIASLTVRPCSNTSGAACTVNVTAPAGWTLVSEVDQTTGAGTGGFGNILYVYRRVATAAEPASYVWNIDGRPGHAGAAGAILSFSGVDTTNPIVAELGQTTGNALTHTAPSIDTTGVPNAMLVTTHSDNSSATWTPPASMTERADIASLAVPDDLGLSLEVNTQSLTTAGATGTRTATQSNTATSDTGATHALALRPKITVTHYSISVSSTSVATCDTVQVTITGHDASHNATAVPVSRSLTLTTSTASGIWQGPGAISGTGTWTPSGANNGQATYLWPGGQTSFSVLLRQNSAGSLNINLNDGSIVEGTGIEDPTITFVDSAFRISNGAGAAATIGTQISGKPSNTGSGSQTLFLQAINSGGSGSCGTLLPTNTDVDVQVGAQCNNPASCTQNVTLTSSALAGNTATFTPNGGFPATMKFRFTTANSEAPFVLNYADAGQITLQFRVQLPSSSPAKFVQGTSNAFVVRPFGIAFRGADSLTQIAHSNSATAPAAPFAAAGDNFTMTLAAYKWASGQDANSDGVPDSTANITLNGTTPNFAATATVSPVSNLAGAAGNVSRGATCASAASIALAGGTATASDWCYSEVGNVLLGALVTNYLGGGQDVTGSSGLDGSAALASPAPNVGRFRPKHFALITSASPLTPSVVTRSDLTCSPSASSFTYMDETFRLAFKVVAQNAQNQTTTNYNGAYARNAANFAAWGFGAKSGATNLTSRLDSGGTLSGGWVNGVADMTFNTSILRNTPDTPDGPYPALHIGIAPTDADGSAMNTLDLAVGAGNDHKDLLTTDVRFGRMRLDNALGSEAQQLPVSMRVEYWNGSGFTRNADDNCTSIPRSAIRLDFTPVSNLSACETMVTQSALAFVNGLAPLVLSKAGAGNTGTVVLSVNLTGTAGNYCDAIGVAFPSTIAMPKPLPYLRGRWNDAVDGDGNANTAYDDNPSARAAFGLYGSQPGNFIYFRERFD